MTTPTEQREHALAAAEGTCPRCGAERAPEQEYCVECGLRLPPLHGRLPALRRRWVRRLGWYPGDWVWISLLTLLVAAAGAAIAIVVTQHARAARGATVVVPPVPSLSVREPSQTPTTTPATVDTGALPTAPEPTTSKAPGAKPRTRSALTTWPAGENGWTIVLVSYPMQTGRTAARATATRARKSGLKQVGILDSSRYPSLQPGYLVVFTGVYGRQDDAAAGVATARQAGFAGAYVRQVAR